MARNKYPEETIQKILNVSLKLFLEKGYEHTSIQDIVENLGGLSKGAIYHHFKSKDEILIAVMDQLYEVHDSEWVELRRDNTKINGRERLKKMLEASLYSNRQTEVFQMAPDLLKNPQMLVLQLKGIYETTVPEFILPIIEAGVADGSIVTDYPKEMAEVIFLLLNIWVTPMVYDDELDVLKNRIRFFKEILEKMGLDIIDDRMISRFEEFCYLYKKNK
ncbi:MAG: TetR/AcrR family transcriptional regulator [Lachnospiraceae bacterium]